MKIESFSASADIMGKPCKVIAEDGTIYIKPHDAKDFADWATGICALLERGPAGSLAGDRVTITKPAQDSEASPTPATRPTPVEPEPEPEPVEADDADADADGDDDGEEPLDRDALKAQAMELGLVDQSCSWGAKRLKRTIDKHLAEQPAEKSTEKSEGTAAEAAKIAERRAEQAEALEGKPPADERANPDGTLPKDDPQHDYVSEGREAVEDAKAAKAEAAEAKANAEKRAAANGSIVESLAGAKKLRDIVGILFDAGYTEVPQIVKACEAHQEQLPLLRRMTNLPERIERVAERLGIGEA